MVQPPQAHNDEKYDSNGEVDFRFDDGNKMSYKNSLSITWSWMGQFNTYNPTFCEKNKEGNYIYYTISCALMKPFFIRNIVRGIYVSLHNHAPAFYRARWLVKVTRHV